MDGESSAALHFPDVPKLELDQLIDQLVDRAHDVRRTQGRLRALVRAIETVTGELALETVLRTIVEAARTLAGARYGALGVIGSDGLLERFVHVGMDEATVHAIGPLPQGKGLLGALITDPRPIRLAHLGDDERSAGFPHDHPSMDSFLGVPVRVGGEVFGNLYLTDSVRGEFSAEDEELVVSLALAAGTAIKNARLYDESRMQQRWLRASVEISAQILSPEGEDPLQLIARRSVELAGAATGVVALLTPDDTDLVIEIAVGVGADSLAGQRVPLADTLANDAVTEGRPLLTAGADERMLPVEGLEAGPAMIIPLREPDRVRGVLTLIRARGASPFSDGELEMAAGFAGHAGVALELADTRVAEQRVVLLEDRDRIARDLHDHVIQEMFAIGLSLESVAAMLGADHPAVARLQQRVSDIDRTIRRIRTSIFELRGPLDGLGDGLRQAILEITTELTPVLGFPPHLSFAGAVDLATDADITDDVRAVVREALTNVAKHAHARSVSVDVAVTAGTLTVTVTDNGVGVGGTTRSSGIGNLRSRAERRGGTFDLGPGVSGGTVLTWKAPL